MTTVVGDLMVTLREIINKYIPKIPNHLHSNYLVGNSRMKWPLVIKWHHFTIILLFSLVWIIIRCMALQSNEKCGLVAWDGYSLLWISWLCLFVNVLVLYASIAQPNAQLLSLWVGSVLKRIEEMCSML
jgi:hypothetical protein